MSKQSWKGAFNPNFSRQIQAKQSESINHSDPILSSGHEMTIEKRYQIFISSTFRDLIDERQAALKAILELNHMPAGMELFPATDNSAWDLIKDIIDASDYYILIIGGRYGSMDESGIGYTEKEYDYAHGKKKPVIPLLIQNPDNLVRQKTETDEIIWNKLKSFRDKIENRHTCVYWSSVDELKAKLILGLTASMKKYPAIGWVRASEIPSDATIRDILNLKQKILELEEQLEKTKIEPPSGIEELSQGDDKVNIDVLFDVRDANYARQSYSSNLSTSWNEIFSYLGPTMINEAKHVALELAFSSLILGMVRVQFGSRRQFSGGTIVSATARDLDFQTCLIQFRALGLIHQSPKKHSVTDSATYWSLTPYGDTLLVQLKARTRNSRKHEIRSGSPEEEEVEPSGEVPDSP